MKIIKRIQKDLDKENILELNEIQANKLVGFTMFISAIFLFFVLVICSSCYKSIQSNQLIVGTLIQGIIELTIPAFICQAFKAKRIWLKYILLIFLVVVFARIYSLLGHYVTLIMTIPIILSCRYFSSRFTKLISGTTIFAFFFAVYGRVKFKMGVVDLNYYSNNVLLYMKKVLLTSYLPKVLIFIIISIICVKIAEIGKKMVFEESENAEKNARRETELDLAKNIQEYMLPKNFPPNSDCKEVEIYATMNTAKEVGGDFYDFFMINDKRVAIVIGDVSGKGIPAALFMTLAKSLIKNEALAYSDPAEVFTRVNHKLSKDNEYVMFVTAWMGILDTESGILTYVNAGHNCPYIEKENGEFLTLKTTPGFVLAGMDGIRYEAESVQLYPNDKIFIYTDGVTEATNFKKELYGNNRLEKFLNEKKSLDVKDTLIQLKSDIDNFVGNEKQFDDITMLIMKYKEAKKRDGFFWQGFKPEIESLADVLFFIESKLEEKKCEKKLIMQCNLCIEEIFTNIVKYGYVNNDVKVIIGLKVEKESLTIQIEDHGIPFNPLLHKDPDVNISANERKVGGLGIFLVKKIMDDVEYKYKYSRNILIMKKNILKK